MYTQETFLVAATAKKMRALNLKTLIIQLREDGRVAYVVAPPEDDVPGLAEWIDRLREKVKPIEAS